jgi:hypothetical protein
MQLIWTGLFAQKTFSGTFLMTFTSTQKDKDFPLLWTVEKPEQGSNLALQIQDPMMNKGVSKRVVFNPKDSIWTMLISFNKIKQGTRIHAAAMYRDTVKQRRVTIRTMKEFKYIEGYKCQKITIDSDKYLDEVWITEKIDFDLCSVYRLISHCGMMSDVVRKGDWFMTRSIRNMILEAKSSNKSSHETYTMHITGINKSIDFSYFDMQDFKIADIPEGQSCGVELKDE